MLNRLQKDKWPHMTSNELKWPWICRGTHIFKTYVYLVSALRHYIHINQCKKFIHMSHNYFQWANILTLNDLIYSPQWPEMTLNGLFFYSRSMFLLEIIDFMHVTLNASKIYIYLTFMTFKIINDLEWPNMTFKRYSDFRNEFCTPKNRYKHVSHLHTRINNFWHMKHLAKWRPSWIFPNSEKSYR